MQHQEADKKQLFFNRDVSKGPTLTNEFCLSAIHSDYPNQGNPELTAELKKKIANFDLSKHIFYEQSKVLPRELIKDLGEMGLLSFAFPKSVGGGGLSMVEIGQIAELLAPQNLSIAQLVGYSCQVLSSLLMTRKDLCLSTLEKYFRGEISLSYAQTEIGAGSNILDIWTTAERNEKNNTWRIKGTKTFFMGAETAELFFVVARHGHLFRVFAVPRSTPGITFQRRVEFSGFQELDFGTTSFDVEIPYENAVDLPNEESFDCSFLTMNLIRLLCLPSTLGVLKHIFQLTCSYAAKRPISAGWLINQEVFRWQMGEVSHHIHLLESMNAVFYELLDRGESLPQEACFIAKCVAPRFGVADIDICMRFLGARGSCEETGFPKLAREMRLYNIFEGPLEVFLLELGRLISSSTTQNGLSVLFCDILQNEREFEWLLSVKERYVTEKTEGSQKVIRYLLGDMICWTAMLCCFELIHCSFDEEGNKLFRQPGDDRVVWYVNQQQDKLLKNLGEIVENRWEPPSQEEIMSMATSLARSGGQKWNLDELGNHLVDFPSTPFVGTPGGPPFFEIPPRKKNSTSLSDSFSSCSLKEDEKKEEE
mmetsp:Transcript_15/g.30  ORF Transcript_15/g.30 Transcript_15/m.30 type:complete len:594 (-) Transcript_15:65-1846(-)|eukprot:CAMPEP_0201490326 /NCGR_PEP_ID=MMETSP0151_2-20130828/26244_1 /ASSEMBLY_ACC=CAM_ASM_000257 /TAXON_ID=200890 /ORGANISM="Paramoeba atlantica, Strain 621/1 / CCAP 1560/9" /LENGTH=593 /DNA_ID=CAMNT_0047876257 /DNA_START=52 /DNA_END=1833 /DNA_ORIENTATION=+